MEELPSHAAGRGLSRLEEYKVPLLAHLCREHLLACCGGTPLVDAFWLGGLETVTEARPPVSSRRNSRLVSTHTSGLGFLRQGSAG